MKASFVSNITVACLASALALIAAASPLPAAESLGPRHNMHTQTTSNVEFPNASSDVLDDVSASVGPDSESVANTMYKLTRREPLPPHPDAENMTLETHDLRREIASRILRSLIILGTTRPGDTVTRPLAVMNIILSWEKLTKLDVDHMNATQFQNYKNMMFARMRAYQDIVTDPDHRWDEDERTAAAHCLLSFYNLLHAKGYDHDQVTLELQETHRAGDGLDMFRLNSTLNEWLSSA